VHAAGNVLVMKETGSYQARVPDAISRAAVGRILTQSLCSYIWDLLCPAVASIAAGVGDVGTRGCTLTKVAKNAIDAKKTHMLGPRGRGGQ
jgi:hypothetical protein